GDEWRRRRQFLATALERAVGVLSERSRGRYQFLHTTFQEYLAGLWFLIAEPEHRKPGAPLFDAPARLVAERIVQGGYLGQAHWRQPLLLLCGQLAFLNACTKRRLARPAPLLADVIRILDETQQQGQLGLLGEQWAIFLAEVVAEVPEESLLGGDDLNVLLARTLGQLIDAYGRFGPDET